MSTVAVESGSNEHIQEIGKAHGMPQEVIDNVKSDITGAKPEAKDVSGVSGKRLLSFVERIERLEEEKDAISEDIKEVYSESKGVGFDVKTIRKIVKLRKMESEKRAEEQALLELYANAVQLNLF